MQWIGRILQTRRAFLAPAALVLFASIAVAASSEMVLPGGNFDVSAVVTPGSGGGGVEFTGHEWDEKIDMSIGIDGGGEVTVNGAVIGTVDVSRACHITAQFVHDANGDYVVDVQKRIVFGIVDGQQEPIRQIQGMKFEILVELANSWYRSPGELVPYWKLERFSEGDDSRASLRVRIREIKDALGKDG